MKKALYIIGIISVNIILFGILFKSQHWPGAGILMTLGILIFCFYVLPFSLINHYKGNNSRNIWLYIVIFLSVFLNFLAFLFKIQHWPGAGIMFLIAVPAPFVLFLPVYIFYHNKSKEPSNRNFLATIFLLIFIAIFSSFMAIGVSRDFLNSFVVTGNEILKSKTAIQKYNKLNLTDYSSEQKNMVAEKYSEVNGVINEAKLAVFNHLSDNHIHEIDALPERLTLQYGFENINIGWYIMLSDDGYRYAYRIKDLLNEFNETCSKLNIQEINSINELLSTTDIELNVDGEVYYKIWEDWYFRRTQLISVYNHLSLLETNVALAEKLVVENN
jgi:heme/copper-type cytochrome/quinol oxidase subunit 4